jgi:hypothetical protein
MNFCEFELIFRMIVIFLVTGLAPMFFLFCFLSDRGRASMSHNCPAHSTSHRMSSRLEDTGHNVVLPFFVELGGLIAVA